MDSKLLRNFVEIVESGNMTAASHKLFIAQPVLSNQLRALEQELGVRLLERTSRSQKLTDAGQLFYQRAKDILALENLAVKEARDCELGERGTLRLGMTPSTAITLFDGILTRFCRMWPQIRYQLYEMNSVKLLQLLETGAIDVAVVRTPCHFSAGMEPRFISGEQLVAAYRPDRFSFGEHKRIPLSELTEKPLMMIQRYEDLVTAACGKAGLVPNIKCINIQIAVTLKLAQAGLGVAIVPLSTLAVSDDPLEYRVIDEPTFAISRAIVTMRGKTPSAVCSHFLELCREAFPTEPSDLSGQTLRR
ncbi:MAG: LysR family transcriptional regulator [Firmicutes bacterium]|nr:LysR family transcriptional regulator [Bacillota bacterium]